MSLTEAVMAYNTLCDRIEAASKAEDWDLVSQLMDERRCAEVDLDEKGLSVPKPSNEEIFDFEDRAPSEDWA